jgi:alkyl sulfatase BDS1-like metallo-beta-lactamase superfamily hydrolase
MPAPIAADFSDRADFANSDRGFIGTMEPMVITAADGRVVWDMDSWGFLDGDCPATANPSLWRQAQLTARHGLYEVTDGIYQVRGAHIEVAGRAEHHALVTGPMTASPTPAPR